VQDYPPVGWRFADEILLFSCYCLLVSCGLLLACPSPPGLAPGVSPSPPGKLLVPALLLLIRGCSTLPPSLASRDSIPGFGLLDVVWCCENLVFSWLLSFWLNGCGLSPSRAHLLQLLAKLLCCGDDTTTLSQWD
jgi:hypothetical protein